MADDVTSLMNGRAIDGVDVIIPSRNRVDLTLRAAASVTAQTFTDWKLYIVDDASDDGSGDALEQATRDDARIEVIRRSAPGGAPAARDAAYVRSRRAFIATLDSDDTWHPDKLTRQMDLMKKAAIDHPQVGVVLCGHRWVDEAGHETKPPRIPPALSDSPLTSDNMSTLLIERRVLDAAGGFDTGFVARTCDNVETYVRLSRYSTFASVQEVLVDCLVHAGARESDRLGTRESAAELGAVVAKHREHLSAFPSDMAELEARYAARLFEAGDKRGGLRELRKALGIAPGAEKLRLLRRFGPHSARRLISRPV